MRWLCNENVPRILVEALKHSGHDVVWMAEAAPGSPDSDVIARAARERRICLTFDKDFGELAAATNLPPASGVLLLRIPVQPTPAWATDVMSILETRADWSGHFSVLEPGRVRLRPLTALR